MAHKLSNNFSSVQLLSLKNIKLANEIPGRDHGGPYVVMQHGCDPEDQTFTAEDFILGKSGAWLATKWFVRLPVADRRAEFVFATCAEVITLLESLTHGVKVRRPGGPPPEAAADDDDPLNQLVQSNSRQP